MRSGSRSMLASFSMVFGVIVLACSGSTPAPSSATGRAAPTAAPATAAPAAAVSPSSTASHAQVPLLGAAPVGNIDPGTGAALQAALDDVLSSGAPDVIAAVVTPAGAWSGAAGVDGPGGRKATAQDVAAIASVSKLFVASLVMRLVERGAMRLDDPLDTYLSEVGVTANGATVREALTMRSGIGNTVGATGVCDRQWTRDDVIGTFPEPHASPGGDFEYSNPTYKLLGFAIESVTGLGLADALDSEVLGGVASGGHILLQGVDRPAPEPWALPIEGHSGGLDVTSFGSGDALPCMGDAQLSLGAAGMAADMPTLARWGYELFAGRIVSPGSLAEMLPANDEYGLGLKTVGELGAPGSRAFGHTGSKAGYKVILVYQPARAAVVAVLINDGSADDSLINVIVAAHNLIEVLPGP